MSMLKAWSLLPGFLRRRLLVGELVRLPNGQAIRTLQYLVGGTTGDVLRNRDRIMGGVEHVSM